MPNMSYCRFENTSSDLEDCIDHWEDELSESENKSKKILIFQAIQILKMEGYVIDKED